MTALAPSRTSIPATRPPRRHAVTAIRAGVAAASAVLASAVLACARPTPAPAPLPAAPIAIVHATVIDVRAGRDVPAQTIVLDGGRIVDVGADASVRIPVGARVVDATGRFVMPGLWDMHAHVRTPTARTVELPLFLANGVTGIREMGSDCKDTTAVGAICIGDLRRWQREIETGALLGPRLLALSSWHVDGPRDLPKNAPAFFRASTPEEATQLVQYFADRGVDFIKVYNNIPRQGYFALMREARRRHMTVVGHNPVQITARELSDSGQHSVEHARVFLFYCWPGAEQFWTQGTPRMTVTQLLQRMVDDYDPAICGGLFQTYARNDTWYVPTHVTRAVEAHASELRSSHDPRDRYIPRAMHDEWVADVRHVVAADSSPAGRKAFMDFYTKGLEVTGAAYRAGVRIMAGTDAGDSFVYPGFSMHDELAELVKAGLTPAQALRAATLDPAEFLGRTTDFGTVERGKVADLVIVAADPLRDIHNTVRIDAVVEGGHYLDRAALDAILRGVADTVTTAVH